VYNQEANQYHAASFSQTLSYKVVSIHDECTLSLYYREDRHDFDRRCKYI